MNKKLILIVYYSGLIIGILIMNTLLKNYKEYGDLLAEHIQGMDKLQFINKKELFIYIFLKRAKQACVFWIFFTQISKLLALYLFDFYFAMVEGLFLSLCTYYYGIGGVGKGTLLMIPQFVCFLAFQFLGWIIFRKVDTIPQTSLTSVIFVSIFVLIIEVMLEISVNYCVML